ncbi:hypothetical protein L596_007832 [Steinernema carpocapsae]|uniref:Uncharacterized protein n=1 Tax=Steinernema carpocapsae TaxID=34508 RepID=A0A4U5PAK5_STECR|nr:hypothetical protein L596_007832 [Steinernema carpocapsae]
MQSSFPKDVASSVHLTRLLISWGLLPLRATYHSHSHATTTAAQREHGTPSFIRSTHLRLRRHRLQRAQRSD